MSALRLQSFVNPEEYLALDRAAEGRSEYYAGEMVAMSGASYHHEVIVANMMRELGVALRGKPCRPVGSNLRVRVRKANYLYPDVTVVCGDPEFAEGEYLDTILNPTVVCEVLSKSTESQDRGIKMRLYEQLPSLEHYVLIHQDIIRMVVHTRHNDVDWLEQVENGPDAKLELPAIGVTLALSNVYENAIPKSGTMDA